jgi:four helix bundle protein
MNHCDLKLRTQNFALDIIKLVESLPRNRTSDILGRQLLRSGTSVGANYRSANRAKSSADFIAKISIVEEEADETIYWMEILKKSNIITVDKVQNLIKEANELVAIAVASAKTARTSNKRR